MVRAFCNAVEADGYYAMNYSNQDYIRSMFESAILTRFDLWYAWYNPTLNRDAGIWQYTSSGKVRGIIGKVDRNKAYKDYPALIRQQGLNHLGKSTDETVNHMLEDGVTTPENREGWELKLAGKAPVLPEEARAIFDRYHKKLEG